jgi:photosystem II stability/assembly factor-like uncharacterized protein
MRGTCKGSAGLALLVGLLAAATARSAEWQAVTTELLKKLKPGFGGLCGVVVDHSSGDVYIDVSERGIFRSTDQGRTWKAVGARPIKGRTEWPGCLLLDPTGKSKRLLVATVYGGPVAVSTAGGSWRFMDGRSSHVDWCAVDWSDAAMKFVLALKHESGGLLLASTDGGKTFRDVGKGYGPAWVFDARTAVVAELRTKERPRPALLRTTDGGKTFARCGGYRAEALPKWQKGTLYWLVEGALIASTDRGATWKKVGPVKDGRCGPIFGKSERHLFVLTNAGIVASSDGGVSWSAPLALPKELRSVGALSWLEYDPVRDVLYAMKMGSQLYRLSRSARK